MHTLRTTWWGLWGAGRTSGRQQSLPCSSKESSSCCWLSPDCGSSSPKPSQTASSSPPQPALGCFWLTLGYRLRRGSGSSWRTSPPLSPSGAANPATETQPTSVSQASAPLHMVRCRSIRRTTRPTQMAFHPSRGRTTCSHSTSASVGVLRPITRTAQGTSVRRPARLAWTQEPLCMLSALANPVCTHATHMVVEWRVLQCGLALLGL
mmetsp:Transcript_28278/g.34340  ORF Transcript_28278/g.34340 Transcript_28278/m.34340 type:complete len:208 (+) Transcript_28278:592-1215(+)